MSDISEQIANLPLEKRRLLELLLLEETAPPPEQRLSAPTGRKSASAPLSFSQERLWFFQQAAPHSAVHNLSSVLRLTGALNVDALERSLRELIRRHEALRTVFPSTDGRPHQSVVEPPSHVITITDLRHLPRDVREAEALRLADEEAQDPFDLGRGPLLRASLLQLDAEEHVLVFTTHHIVSDGWSQSVIVREVSELYRAYSTGTSPHLPPLPIQYADFAHWERERLQGETLASQLAYWRDALDGVVPLELPFDRARQPAPSFRSASETFELSESLTESLRALSRKEGVTLYMTLLASFKVLLHFYTGQEDLSVGSSVANRTRQEIENLVGCFVNLLALRTSLADNPTISEVLRRVREVCLGAFAHTDVPFERVVQELNLERSLNRHPLFQVIFVLMNAPAAEVRLPGVTLQSVELEQGLAENELGLILFEEQERLTGRLTCNADLFAPATVKRMLRHWLRALESMVANPAQRLSDLQLLSDAELTQILHDWNATRTPYERDRCIHELFEAQAEQTPDAVALECGSVRLTYGELNRRANQLARHLQSLGVGPETRVAICTERSVETIVGLVGTLKAGGAYLPLDPTYPLERLRFMLEDSQSHVLLTQERLLDVLPATWAAMVCLDTEWDFIAEQSDENVTSGALADNLCYVMYTSGSTGRPKGVSITHRGVVRLVRETNYASLTAQEVFLQFASISFDAATFEIWGSLLNGARLVLPPAHTSAPEELGEVIRQHGVTTLWLTAALFHQMVEHDAASLRSLNQLLAGGDVLQTAQVQKMLRHLGAHGRLINGYGPTENTTFTSCHVMNAESRIEGVVPIGRPIANTQVYILDKNGKPVPLGVAGELYIGGDGLARDYLNDPCLTAERFVPHPYGQRPGERLYRTGDVARWRADGLIEFMGRRDQQVKVRGFRIELGEVESALLQHRDVRETVVLGREDQEGNRRLVAYIVPVEDAPPLSPEQLREFLKHRLPDYMLPSTFITLEAMPLTRNGKVDRRALPPPDDARPQLANTFAPPATRAERLLAEVWEQVLGVKGIGIHDGFFDLGGDSIRSIEVCALAGKAGLDITVQQLFEYQTIGELARLAGQLETCASDAATTKPFQLISEQDRRRLPPDLEDAYPLTRLQSGMLFHSTFTAEATAYHDIFSYHLSGPCDLEALRSVIVEVFAGQAVLRTSFNLTNYTEALQLVHKEVQVPIEVEDLRHLAAAEQERVIRERVEAERLRRFNWECAPLLRFLIQLRSDRTYQLTLSFHHAILDGWSLASLLAQIFNDYLAVLRDKSREPAPPLGTAFRDYVALELAALESDEQRSYWTRKLEDRTVIRLPRWPRPHEAPDETGVKELFMALSQEQCRSLRQLAQAESVPLKSVLLAAHLRVMSFLSGQTDVLTGLVSNGRPETVDGERLLGLFLNTLPLRLRMKGDSWSHLIRETFATEREMLAFRRFPLDEIQKIHSGGEPLFEACFNFTHYHIFERLREAGEIQLLDGTSSAETNFTLLTTFNVEDSTSEIQLSLGYNSAELCHEQVAAIGRYYLATLQAMADDSHARYDLHSPLSTVERRRLLVEWNDTGKVDARDEFLQEKFQSHAALTPESVALVFNETRWSYGALNRRANQLAHYLRAYDVGPEVRVGILMERTPEMVCAILGVLKAGGAYLPLDPAYPQERLRFMLDDSGATVLLTQSSLLDKLPPHNAHVICLDVLGERLAGESEENPTVALAPHNLAYVIYTSGSTGRPKGVAIEHRSAVVFLSWVRRTFSAEELAGVLFSTSICFDLSIFELFAPLGAGGKIILAENALQLPALGYAGEVTLINLVPSALSALLEADGIPASVMTVNLAGEPLGLELVRRTYETRHVERVFNLYGPSEDTTYSTFILLDRQSDAPPPIGRPIANTQIYVLDNQLQPVPVGAPGLLYIGGCGLARGYFNESRLTAERFIPDPFSATPGQRLYHTGDVARYLPDGNLEFIGRADHQVKLRGFRIELGEVEAALKQHPRVQQAVVSALDNGSGEKQLVAHVVLDREESSTAQDLHAFLKEKLPGYMVPAAFVSLDKLPLTPNGKINRAALPAPERNSVEVEDIATLPRDTLELRLIRIWEELLGVAPVGVRDNFFLDLGGHSILAVRLIAQVEKQLGHRLSLSTLVKGPTIAELALALRHEGAAEPATPLVVINPNGSKSPFFCVHPATGSALCYVHLARQLGIEQPFYGLQAPGLDGETTPLGSIEEMASSYIAALQTVQPHGPYFLGGHSFGGIVAYEMACRLKEAGHEIALLAILDTMAPLTQADLHAEDNRADDARWLCDIVRVFERFLNKCLSIRYEELEPLDFEEQLAFVLSRLKEIDLFSQDAGTKKIRGLLQVEKSNVRAAQQYVPRFYPGEVTLFRAAELQHEDLLGLPLQRYLNLSLGWETLTAAPVETHIVVGDHITMIAEPHVSSLAAQLQAHLDGLAGR